MPSPELQPLAFDKCDFVLVENIRTTPSSSFPRDKARLTKENDSIGARQAYNLLQKFGPLAGLMIYWWCATKGEIASEVVSLLPGTIINFALQITKLP